MGIILVLILICISVTVFIGLLSAAAFYGGTAIGKRIIERIRWMLGIEKKGGDQ